MTLKEHDITFDGFSVHCWESEAGLPILMMHGSGPGVSTVGNWGQVLAPLAERYHVLAFDLIGFGLSDRKSTPPYFDMDLWLRQARAMLDGLPDGPVGIIAHSLSASLALQLAAETDRVAKLVTTGAMGARFKLNPHMEKAWTFPETVEQLRETFESVVYDQSMITEAFLNNRMEMLQRGDYKAYFTSMFEGNKQDYIDAAAVPPEALGKVKCEVLMMHGRQDRVVPFEETTLPLAQSIHPADIFVFGRCGHGVAQEQSEKFLAAATAFFG